MKQSTQELYDYIYSKEKSSKVVRDLCAKVLNLAAQAARAERKRSRRVEVSTQTAPAQVGSASADRAHTVFKAVHTFISLAIQNHVIPNMLP